MARVLSYDHGDVTSNRTLKSMSDDLLRLLSAERAKQTAKRPLFFICHSVGGLVVKLALTQAKRSAEDRSVIEDCYGITFFATPHRGSSHLSSWEFHSRIQELLGLSKAFTPRLMDGLKLDHPTLLQIDKNFKQLASELRVWTFYETEDSTLSGDGAAGPEDIPVKAPITSRRSAILTLRHEKVYALQSNHANCASFGVKNVQIMRKYLQDLANEIRRAEQLSRGSPPVPVKLELEQRVKVEVHGFYESDAVQDSTLETNLRLFSTRNHTLQEFWDDGPDGLLEKRLKSNYPEYEQFVLQKGRARFLAVSVADLNLGDGDSSSKRQMAASRLPPENILYPSEPRGGEPTSRQDMRAHSKRTSPSNSTPKFVWIHVPFNNPLWVEKVFGTLSVKEKRDYSELFNTEHWASRHARGRHSQHHACFLKPACGYTPLKAQHSPIMSRSSTGPPWTTRGDSLTSKQQGQGCLYLYFPFLHFDSYKTLIRRRDMIQRRMRQGRTRPVPPDIAKETSRELQVIWEYLEHDPPINCRRTLDQYRYPSLHDTRARDDNQLLYRMTRERIQVGNNGHRMWKVSRPVSRGDGRAYTQRDDDEASGDDDDEDDRDIEHDSDLEHSDASSNPDEILDGNVLMVDQLWLWVVDTSKATPHHNALAPS